MTHLRPEARDLALLPATERLARMPANRWIGYTRASQALTLLDAKRAVRHRDVRRLGRKTRLQEEQRAVLWKIFEGTRARLDATKVLTRAAMFTVWPK